DSVETYSPALGRDLEDLPLADIGDCELPDGAPPREQLDAARVELAAWWRPGLIPFMLGGDHTATVPVMEVIAPAVPGLRGHRLARARRTPGAGARRDRPDARRVSRDRRRPRRGRPRVGPDWSHRHRRRLDHPGGHAHVVGRPPVKSRYRDYAAPRLYEIAF